MNGRCSCIEWQVIPLVYEIAITVVDSVANELACGSQTNECNRTVQRSTMIKDQIKDIIA